MQIMDWDISVQVSSERPSLTVPKTQDLPKTINERIDKGRME